MSGSTFGTIFQVTAWGESHGKALGAVIDGCPPRIPLSEDDINEWLARRKPGGRYSTKRAEEDRAEILSGVFEGVTTGTPISVIVWNKDARSSDYNQLRDVYRPSHADYTYSEKYGVRDYRGGGRASGRETVSRVIAGAVAGKALDEHGITATAYVKSIGEIEIDTEKMDLSEMHKNPLCMPDKHAAERACELLDKMAANGNSVGGVVECVIEGLPAGLGEPVFDKLDAEIAKAVMSIGAVKGVEFGNGFCAARLTGSKNNDGFYAENGVVRKTSNNAGGVLGGISDGSQVVFRAAFKPTPSIASKQKTVTVNKENTEITINGRHDPVIVPRAVVVVEAMAAITVLDMLMIHKARGGWLK